MQQERTDILKKTLYYLPTLLCMGIIFWLSSKTADESSRQSGVILEWITSIFGNNIFTDFIVRKLAHCLEFAGLCLMLKQ